MIVSNASTLILLAKIDLLDWWIKEAHILIIPSEVYEEICMKNEDDTILIKKKIDEKKVIIQSAAPEKINNALRDFRMDLGEAAAYALFDAEKHDGIMTDDRELIKLCKLNSIRFVNALAIIITLYQQAKISRATALEKLQKVRVVGRYSNEVYTHFQKIIEG